MPKTRKKTKKKQGQHYLTALGADGSGNIIELEGYAAVGMDGSHFQPLTADNTVKMPYGGEMMYLPDRRPVVYDPAQQSTVILDVNPYAPDEPVYPVAAFNSPGHVQAFTAAYVENGDAAPLPLFSYGAVGWGGDSFRSPLIPVDDEPRQDLRKMPMERIQEGVLRMRFQYKENRLCRHLEKCALEYGCPAAKNFFLQRYEAPLPTSSACNARCLGCLSLQTGEDIHCSQDRIDFTPTPEEIAEVALEHILNVKESVVSFGQGCEGDPLLAGDAISAGIGLIRKKTGTGTINMNTNAGLPHVLETLFDAGLDSIRVSMNSVREPCYTAYFRPKGYSFSDVLESIDRAINRGKHVAINYLNCPGFTDTPEEYAAFLKFRKKYPVHMIQWRNLNFDPIRYIAAMNAAAPHSAPMGMRKLLDKIHEAFPDLRFGYFNPPKEAFYIFYRRLPTVSGETAGN